MSPAKKTSRMAQAAPRVAVTKIAVARSAPVKADARTLATRKAAARVSDLVLATLRVPVSLRNGALHVETITIDAPTRIVFYLDGSLSSATFESQVGSRKGFHFIDPTPPKVFATSSLKNFTEVRVIDRHTQLGQWRFELNLSSGESTVDPKPSHKPSGGGPIIINR